MTPADNMELAKNKLILLYIIDKVDVPISNHQIMKIILENRIMNYFSFQELITELFENNLLISDTSKKRTLYSITSEGKQTLSYLISLIPKGIKSNIDTNLANIKNSARNENLIMAEYFEVTETEYIVSCRADEDDFTLLDLKLTVGTKRDARDICENWKKNSSTIYPEIIEILTKKR